MSLITFPVNSYGAIFGSVEFKAPSLNALPKWTNVLDKIESEQTLTHGCDLDYTRCSTPSLLTWREFLRKSEKMEGRAHEDFLEFVSSVNSFVNQWPYINDLDNWGRSDYWASPIEFLEKSGDCEDYAILKYVTLRELGVEAKNLRIVVVRDTLREIAHAVLAVYHSDQVYILDSLFNAVLPDYQVIQYVPYYSINEQTRWAHVMPSKNN